MFGHSSSAAINNSSLNFQARLKELPRLHDLREPAVERPQRRHLIEIAAADKPYFSRLSERCISAVKRRPGCAVQHNISELLSDPRRLIFLKTRIAYLRLACGQNIGLRLLSLRSRI